MTSRRLFIGSLAAAGVMARGSRAAVAEPAVLTVLEGIASAGPLAVTRTGQTLSVLEPSQRRIVAIDPAEPLKRWTALDAAADDTATIEAMTSLDSSTLIAVWRSGEEWSLRVHRVRPPGDDMAEAATLQTLPLGRAAGTARIDVVVSPSRNLVAVAGLPSPLPPLLRGRITGARLDGPTDRRCPSDGARRPAGVAFGPGEEWILLTVPAATPDAEARLAWFSPAGGDPLLELDTGLPGVRDAAWDNEGGLLYALGGLPGSASHPEGLWRVDAALVDRRQTCRPVCVARFAAPHSLVCLPRHTVMVSQAAGMGRVTRVSVPDEPVDAATVPGGAGE